MDLRTASDIGAAIRERRRQLGRGQADLANDIGVSRQWLSGVENGRPGAELGLVLRTLNILGLRLNAQIQDKAGGRKIDAIVNNARKSRQ